ncbi:MAG: 4-hydroxy-3-methylbut-2-enyl diphosphate reductase [Nitrospirota bacterium]|nr:4-hydroxy-3-methylbut-2-enyl diphosphate reductase [Nitrospirota bacterium]
MDIYIAKGAGFCFGVKRAVNIAFRTAERSVKRVATLGPIIHNPQVVEKLRQAGVKPLDKISEDVDILIVRTHGIPVSLYESLRDAKFELIDATCPFVKKAQQYAKLLREEGYQVLILGDKDHPEVKGILSYAGESAIVVRDSAEIPLLNSRVGIVVQTTQPVEALKKLLDKVIQTVKEVKVYNTICNSTALRLRETEDMTRKVDLMLVVGGKNSANTKQLVTLCNDSRVKTYHVETAGDLCPEWFDGVGKVGITAGASTPDWIINDIVKKIEAIGDLTSASKGRES